MTGHEMPGRNCAWCSEAVPDRVRDDWTIKIPRLPRSMYELALFRVARADRTNPRTTSRLRRVLALPVLVLPLLLVLVGFFNLAGELFGDSNAVRTCAGAVYRSVITGSTNKCLRSHPGAISVPLFADALSLFGAAASVGILILHVRLSRLILHVPVDHSGARQPNGHQDALSNQSIHRLGLFSARWAITEGDDYTGPSVRFRIASLLVAFAVSTGAYLGYYLHGEMFSRVCGTNFVVHGAQRCEGVARDNWWASWSSHPINAVCWITIAALAMALGADNFMTTTSFARRVTDAFRRSGDGVGPLPFIESFHRIPTSWTFLQGFLAELRLGFLPTTAMLMTVFGIIGTVGTGRVAVSIQVLEIVFVLGFIGFFFARLSLFQSMVHTNAHRTLVKKFDEVNGQLSKAKGKAERGGDDAEVSRFQDHLNWLSEHGVLPPVALDDRLRAYVGYLAGLSGLILALLTLLRT